MSLMMMLALGGIVRKCTPTQMTRAFTVNATWTAPDGVLSVSLSGYGARGTDGAQGTRVPRYYFTSYSVIYSSSGGEQSRTYLSTSPIMNGEKPADYCDPVTPGANGTSSTICYVFADASTYVGGTPDTTGASATAFGKTFPGSTGNVAQSVTTFNDTVVMPGTNYQIVVPDGASITMTWTECVFPLTTVTFTKNTTFVMPVGVSSLVSIVGRGADGTPATPGTNEPYTHVVTSLYRRVGGIDYTEVDVTSWTESGAGTGNGTDYCDPPVEFTTEENAIYSRKVVCYYYRVRTVDAKAATTGASATGFGKVFPGGVSGPSSDVTFLNVPVTAMASYSVVVPAGGQIKITYKV